MTELTPSELEIAEIIEQHFKAKIAKAFRFAACAVLAVAAFAIVIINYVQ
ncbi:MAG: hypothetical protein J6Z40_11570 [Oscillospiraceae bacterium]|nr:hypothetical protein [Oscillospiraceae bacterium]